MSVSGDQAIAVLRSSHDDLAAFVKGFGAEELTKPSAATEWDISQVLSHLGSGAEIGLATLERSLAGDPPADGDFNKTVWARWDAMTPEERGAAFEPANRRLVEAYEALDATQRTDLRINLGFLPEPLDVAGAVGFRLNEFALHAWDVKAAFDPAATLVTDALPMMFPPLEMLLGWISKPAELGGRTATLAVHLTNPERSFGLQLADPVALIDTPASPDGELRLNSEAWLRLTTGRLGERYTPGSVTLTGPFDLDDLRKVFPGF
jgi:uncharacterized protein (TIGR03083 family)